jgi:carboxyl-terminal processing protease
LSCVIARLSSALLVATILLLMSGLANAPRKGADPIGGHWLVSLVEADGVELQFRMTFAAVGSQQSGRWEAYSRAGAAREMVGGGTAALGRLLGKMPPHEALIYVGNGSVETHGDSVLLAGILDSPFLGRRVLNGFLVHNRIQAELKREGRSEVAGTLDAVRDTTDSALRDYAGLARELEATIRATIFDSRLTARPQYQSFFKEIHARFAKAGDDLDAVASFQALKPSLGTSHLDFIRNPKLAVMPLDSVIAGNQSVAVEKFVTLSFPTPFVALLRVSKWDRIQNVLERAFARIDALQPRVLVLDIRNNPGGDASSMVPLMHVLRDTLRVGVFLGRQWYDTHSAPPLPSDYSAIPELSTDGRPAQLFYDIRTKGAVVGKVVPHAPYYSGTMYVLVDNGTASASEPLVHVLKTTHRATIIGERTAGAMLTALPHALPDGWVVTVPEANFIAADGTVLEGHGVQPDIQSPRNDVYLKLADQLSRSDPYSAAVIRAGSLVALKQNAEAERAYRDAIRIGDSQVPALSPESRASIHKGLASLLVTRGDRDGARREYEAALRISPADSTARSALEKLK